MHSPGAGLATIHRIARAALRNPSAMPYPSLLEEVRAAVQLVVFLARDARGRRVVSAIDRVTPEVIQPVFVRERELLVRVEGR
ncbi:MAG: hypothetical protein ACP5QO_05775 [Clostridia bacterium]